MVSRRTFLTLVTGVGSTLVYHSSSDQNFPDGARIDNDLVELLAGRTRALRASSTEAVEPLIPRLETHGRLLFELFRSAPREHRNMIGRMAAEVAWLTANAHSDNADDQQCLHWAAGAARVAREVEEHDLYAHAVSRVSRTYLSLKDAARAVAAIRKIDVARLSPYGQARTEVHRALSLARLEVETPQVRTKAALDALDVAHEALLGDAGPGDARPSWVWWSDDAGFLASWRAEVLRSLNLPRLAVPTFRSALAVAAIEDNRERPFLQAGLAEVIAQRGDVDEAAEEAIRAVVLAKATGTGAALDRIRKVYRALSERAPDCRHVLSLREALRS